jgi:hypothetical protein
MPVMEDHSGQISWRGWETQVVGLAPTGSAGSAKISEAKAGIHFVSK